METVGDPLEEVGEPVGVPRGLPRGALADVGVGDQLADGLDVRGADA